MNWLVIYYAPINEWLALLADGWRLPWIVDRMRGSHGAYSIMLERDE